MVVNNAVDGDSRVQKIAWSMADQGYDVTLLGVFKPDPQAPLDGQGRRELELGRARVLLVPLLPVVSGYDRRRGSRPSAERRAQWRQALAQLRAWDAAEVCARPGVSAAGRVPAGGRARLAGVLASPTPAGRGLDRALEVAGTGPVGGRLAQAGALTRALADRHGGWRQFNPFAADLELALGPVLVELAPDLVHAHDAHTIGITARAVARLRAGGHAVRWVYDAHEYVAGQRREGVPTGPAAARLAVRHRFLAGVEREYAALADAVVTVSEPIAERMRAELGLRVTPLVVRNVPPAPPSGAAAPSLRAAAGVDAGTPLLVYSGSCAPQRGVATLVDALPALPGVHLAMVAAATDPHLADLLARAATAGVAGRVHAVGYVAPDLVPGYLAEADAGVSPLLHRPNHELSLNTKYAEYMHARLPVLTSDVAFAADFTRRAGIGEVFTAGDGADLARAVRLVLDAPDRYRARYTRQLLAEQTWEHQERVLADLYARLSGRAPAVPNEPGIRSPLRLEPKSRA